MRLAGVQAREALKGYAFISPWLIGFFAFTLLPVALSFYYSLCSYSLLQPPVFRGLENYRTLLDDKIFWLSLRNTMYYAAMALPLGLICALCAALLLNARIRGQAIYRAIVFLPSIVPASAAAMIWLWLLNPKLGLVNFVLTHLGVQNPPGWINDKSWAMPALAFISIWGVGNTVVIYLAAELDGAATWRKIWHVTLPTISPVIFFNLITAIIGTMNFFVLPFIMTQGGPDRATYFYTYRLYDNGFIYLKMGYASAMAWVQLLIVLALTGLAFWTARRWVHYSGK
jgi:multiple sugar transport system permease protein